MKLEHQVRNLCQNSLETSSMCTLHESRKLLKKKLPGSNYLNWLHAQVERLSLCNGMLPKSNLSALV